MLEIFKLCKKYKDRTILNNISLKVGMGEIALILGPSGVGKSTLLRIIAGLEKADSGIIALDKNPLNGNKDHRIGMVFQNFNLFDHLTVISNITLPLMRAAGLTHAEAEQRAQELLAKYYLGDKADVYAAQLSGGQKQRLAIARTIAMNPRVICLDEPTSALDPLLTTYIAQTIQELAKNGYIVLVSSHDTHLIARLQCTLYLMQEGSIIESANSEEFKVKPKNFLKINEFVSGTSTSF
jgi:polar amino acid transport system ATP-binding protein